MASCVWVSLWSLIIWSSHHLVSSSALSSCLYIWDYCFWVMYPQVPCSVILCFLVSTLNKWKMLRTCMGGWQYFLLHNIYYQNKYLDTDRVIVILSVYDSILEKEWIFVFNLRVFTFRLELQPFLYVAHHLFKAPNSQVFVIPHIISLPVSR